MSHDPPTLSPVKHGPCARMTQIEKCTKVYWLLRVLSHEGGKKNPVKEPVFVLGLLDLWQNIPQTLVLAVKAPLVPRAQLMFSTVMLHCILVACENKVSRI